nr:serine protease [Scytonema sp. UIC 10036]
MNEAQRLLTVGSNTQVETADDRAWLPKNEPSLLILRPVVFVTAEFNTRERLGVENGTGIVIKREGDRAFIITNRHVIFDKDSGQEGKNIKVEFYSQPPSGKVRMRRSAKLLKMTEPNDPVDLAVLEITGNLPEDIQPLSTSVDPIHRGMPIRAIGHPYDEFPWALHTGEITSYHSEKILISKIPIKQGYSGGPVINSKNNQLVGMIVERDSSGETFAHPISVIKEKLRTLGLQAL